VVLTFFKQIGRLLNVGRKRSYIFRAMTTHLNFFRWGYIFCWGVWNECRCQWPVRISETGRKTQKMTTYWKPK